MLIKSHPYLKPPMAPCHSQTKSKPLTYRLLAIKTWPHLISSAFLPFHARLWSHGLLTAPNVCQVHSHPWSLHSLCLLGGRSSPAAPCGLTSILDVFSPGKLSFVPFLRQDHPPIAISLLSFICFRNTDFVYLLCVCYLSYSRMNAA